MEKGFARSVHINIQGLKKKMTTIMWECRWRGLISPPFSTLVSQRMRYDYRGEHQHDKIHCTDSPTVAHQE